MHRKDILKEQPWLPAEERDVSHIELTVSAVELSFLAKGLQVLLGEVIIRDEISHGYGDHPYPPGSSASLWDRQERPGKVVPLHQEIVTLIDRLESPNHVESSVEIVTSE